MERLGLRAQHYLVLEDSGNGLQAATVAESCTVIPENDCTRGSAISVAGQVVNHLGEADNLCLVKQGRRDELCVDVNRLRPRLVLPWYSSVIHRQK